MWELDGKPPFVDADICTASKPGIQNENTSESDGTLESFPQRRIIVQPETFAKPVDGVFSSVIVDCNATAAFAASTSSHLFCRCSTLFCENVLFLLF